MPKTNPTLKELVDLANKQIGAETLMLPELLKEMSDKEIESISTGLKELDSALGVGGLPKGRIVEIMGQEASGKTTLVLHTIAEAQKKGIQCAYIDVEHALDLDRATKIGVNFDKLLFSQPKTAEQALQLVEFLVRSKEVGLVVLDSVAALVPRAEIEGDFSDANMGAMARLMGKIMRLITGPASKNNVLVVFVNQIRAKMGGFPGFGPQETTAGGNALKFYATVRIDMRKTGSSKTKEFYTTHKISIKKNKVAPPMRVVLCKINESGFAGAIE